MSEFTVRANGGFLTRPFGIAVATQPRAGGGKPKRSRREAERLGANPWFSTSPSVTNTNPRAAKKNNKKKNYSSKNSAVLRNGDFLRFPSDGQASASGYWTLGLGSKFKLKPLLSGSDWDGTVPPVPQAKLQGLERLGANPTEQGPVFGAASSACHSEAFCYF